ncbi:MAG: hypothetical protein J4G14_12150 [Dehalococcoidia bacterium]|nr:hypothetical protein [Dehalococcoidia bacterium]
MNRLLVWYSIRLLRDFDTFAELVIASGIVQWAVTDVGVLRRFLAQGL